MTGQDLFLSGKKGPQIVTKTEQVKWWNGPTWNGSCWMIVAVARNPKLNQNSCLQHVQYPGTAGEKTELFAFKAIDRSRSKRKRFLGGAKILGKSCELGFHEFFETLERNCSGIDGTNKMDKWMFSTLRRWLIIASSLLLMAGQTHHTFDYSFSSPKKHVCREVAGSFISFWL